MDEKSGAVKSDHGGRRQPIGKSTSIPPLTVSLALSVVTAIIAATVFWFTTVDTRNRQDKYIARDAAQFAIAAEERAEIRAHLIRQCIRHAVETNNPDYPCLGAGR